MAAKKICGWVVRLYTLLYVAALGILLIGTLGLFGQPKDPLSGIFLVLITMPLSNFVDYLPGALQFPAMVVLPLVYIAIGLTLCNLIPRRK